MLTKKRHINLSVLNVVYIYYMTLTQMDIYVLRLYERLLNCVFVIKSHVKQIVQQFHLADRFVITSCFIGRQQYDVTSCIWLSPGRRFGAGFLLLLSWPTAARRASVKRANDNDTELNSWPRSRTQIKTWTRRTVVSFGRVESSCWPGEASEQLLSISIHLGRASVNQLTNMSLWEVVVVFRHTIQ